MGMPNLPEEIETCIRIENRGLIKTLLMSIALEEISLSHILNAEGEMMQTFLKKIKCSHHAGFEELIRLNRDVAEALRLMVEKEKTLRDKLIYVLQYHEDTRDEEERKKDLRPCFEHHHGEHEES